MNYPRKKIYLDQNLNFGDLTLFHTSMTHGVDLVDSDVKFNKTVRSGRLMMIGLPVNQNHGLQHAGWIRGSPYTTMTGCRMDQRYWHDGTHLWTALASLG